VWCGAGAGVVSCVVWCWWCSELCGVVLVAVE
jgi:hypothetical protein